MGTAEVRKWRFHSARCMKYCVVDEQHYVGTLWTCATENGCWVVDPEIEEDIVWKWLEMWHNIDKYEKCNFGNFHPPVRVGSCCG
jgi:hypothetical protein